MGSGKNARSAKYRAFGGAVREARARRGLSQETLGFAAGFIATTSARSSAARSTRLCGSSSSSRTGS